MSREKVKIARLPTPAARQTTYVKRQIGLAKKARELSILCSATLALLSFSPAGKPSLVLGQNCDLYAILGRFSRVDPIEREKRKRETLEVLKRSCMKQGHDVNEKLLASDGLEKVEEYCNQLRELQAKIDETNKKLRYWSNLEDTDDKDQISMMEEMLLKSLGHIRQQKAIYWLTVLCVNSFVFHVIYYTARVHTSVLSRNLMFSNRSKGQHENKGKQTGGSSSGRDDMRGIDLNLGN